MYKTLFAALMAMAAAAPMAQAKDLSAMQTAAEIAHDNMERARAEYDADQQRVAASKKNLEQAQQQLAAAEKKAAASQAKYQQAKAGYQRAQNALDSAWKK